MKSEEKPYLEEVNELYKKVRKFEAAVKLKYKYNPMDDTHRHYIKEDIDTVMDAFSKGFSLTPEEKGSLKDTMRSGGMNFMLLRSDEETMSEEGFPLLYIISRPFFQSMKNFVEVDNIYWQEGRCPVCSAVPSLSIIEKEALRRYYCSFCGSKGHYKRIGCSFCQSENPEQINIMYLQDSDEVRVDTCNACKSYVKTFQAGILERHSIEEMDLISLPLDIVAQKKGFHRRSPNPVGIIRIT